MRNITLFVSLRIYPAFVADNTILCRSLNHFISKIVRD